MNDEITPEECVTKLNAFVERLAPDPPEYIYMEEETFNALRQEAILSKTLCSDCVYLMRGNPTICNAFHPQVGVTECADFLSQRQETAKKIASLSNQWSEQSQKAIANSFQPFVMAMISPEFQSSLRAIANSLQLLVKAAQAAEVQAQVDAINNQIERVQNWENSSDRPSYSPERLASLIEEFHAKQKDKEKAEKLRENKHLAKFSQPSYLDGVKRILK